MSAKKLNLKAELLWGAVSLASKEKILKAVWCEKCGIDVTIVDYTVEEDGGDIILKGRCAVCGSLVDRLVETSEARRPKN